MHHLLCTVAPSTRRTRPFHRCLSHAPFWPAVGAAMLRPGKPSGTFYDTKKKRIALQLKDPHKDYEIKPIHLAAEAGDFSGILKVWEQTDMEEAIGWTNSRGQNVFHLVARFGHLECECRRRGVVRFSSLVLKYFDPRFQVSPLCSTTANTRNAPRRENASIAPFASSIGTSKKMVRVLFMHPLR